MSVPSLLLHSTKVALFWQTILESYIWQMAVYFILLLSLQFVHETQIGLHASSAVAQFRGVFIPQLSSPLFAFFFFFSSFSLTVEEQQVTSYLTKANPVPAELRADRSCNSLVVGFPCLPQVLALQHSCHHATLTQSTVRISFAEVSLFCLQKTIWSSTKEQWPVLVPQVLLSQVFGQQGRFLHY